ncbi:MAG: EF-hand domain-containing protein [Lacipirellulaceae bacterium]
MTTNRALSPLAIVVAIAIAACSALPAAAQRPDPRAAAEAARNGTPPGLYGRGTPGRTFDRAGQGQAAVMPNPQQIRAAQEFEARRSGGGVQQGGGVPGFGLPAGQPAGAAPVPGSKPVSARDQRYAAGMFKRYDRNGDRVLTEDEWKRIRGNPERADADADGRITFDELLARVSNRSKPKENAADKQADARKSNRLKTPAERLPEGLPGWFAERDRNGDGQVAMSEYGRRSESTARQFKRYDADNDGFISPDEALAGR